MLQNAGGWLPGFLGSRRIGFTTAFNQRWALVKNKALVRRPAPNSFIG
jgi:hypothetical protein